MEASKLQAQEITHLKAAPEKSAWTLLTAGFRAGLTLRSALLQLL
jgi:hypothetical protein